MAPFDVLVPNVRDRDLGGLLTLLHGQGFEPVATPTTSMAHRATGKRSSLAGDLPDVWKLLRELDDQTYSWPTYIEEYERYRIFEGETEREGTVHIALGEAPRAEAWGRDRKYVVAFLTSSNPQIPLVEMLEVDDYQASRELIGVIRGSDGGKKMYSPTDTLPDEYAKNFKIATYRDRVDYQRSWNKLAVVIREDDDTRILNHALLQARRRNDV